MHNYFITIMVLLSFNNDEQIYRYVQHKEAYSTYSECTYYLNTPQMQQYIKTSLHEHLCDTLISIVEYGCMTKQAYLDYSKQ